MNQPIVSILVPIYGVENYIERCAVSLFEQTYPSLEYIFVDDATPDHSIEILEKLINRYPKRISQVKIYHHEHNKGLSAARNTAVEVATGDYLWHVDSDDYISPQAVEILVNTALFTKADIVIFDVIMLKEHKRKRLQAEYKDKISYLRGLLQHRYLCAHWNKFYLTSFYKGTNIHSVEEIRLAEDYAVTPRLVHLAQRIVALHESLYFYETRNQSSYVHNLNRDAIISHYNANSVLVNYFTQVIDKDLWSNVISLIKQRSVTSLVKQSSRSSWNDIRVIYSNDLCSDVRLLNWVDRIIYSLFRSKSDNTLSLFLYFYRSLYSLIK